MQKFSARQLATGGTIAALYVVLTYLANMVGLASGAVQVRLSEALTILPCLTVAAVPGLTVGCVLANLLTGCALWDVVFGSLATLLGNLSCVTAMRGRVRYTPVPVRESLKHLGPCAVLFISVLAVSIYRKMDKIMVTQMAGEAENGLYEAAEKVIYCLSGFIDDELAFGVIREIME